MAERFTPQSTRQSRPVGYSKHYTTFLRELPVDTSFTGRFEFIIPRLILSQNIFLIVNEAFGIALPEKGSGKFKRPWRRSGRIIRIKRYDLARLLLPREAFTISKISQFLGIDQVDGREGYLEKIAVLGSCAASPRSTGIILAATAPQSHLRDLLTAMGVPWKTPKPGPGDCPAGIGSLGALLEPATH
jgi:hypothetical protein